MRFCSGRTRSRSVPGIRPSHEFHHRDLDAERVVDAGHFQADDAAADHQQALAIERQFQRAARIDDARIIRQPGSRADSDPAAMMHCLKSTRRVPSAPLHIEANTAQRIWLRLGSRPLCAASPAAISPLVNLVTTLIFPDAQAIAVDLRRSEYDAVGRHIGGIFDHLRRMQQGFGRNAADVQAHAAQHRPAFDQVSP